MSVVRLTNTLPISYCCTEPAVFTNTARPIDLQSIIHTNMTTLVETQELTKQYRETKALDRCSLEIRKGEVFGLLGPNGAGKTTLLRLLMGYLRPTSGSAKINGLDCYHDSVKVHDQVAYLPGDVRLFRSMRAKQLLAFFCDVRKTGDLDRAIDMARQLDLNLNTRVSGMSTGMRQKLALAATLAANTPLIILDEPTANLDPNVRSRVGNLVRQARDDGRTVLFSSHVLPEVEESCDRVAILRSGELVHEQIIADLRRQHRIRVRLNGPFPELPAALQKEVTIRWPREDVVVLETPGDLQPFLGYLSTMPVEEIHIEPVGLRAIYDRFHPPEQNLHDPNDGTNSDSTDSVSSTTASSETASA